ncbi:MAG: glycosyltransferase family 2 protein, partial [Pseudomonadota bacterium]
DEVGLFDEALPVCEDYDLWLRTAARYPIYLIDRALVVKEGGAADQLSHSLQGMDRFRITAIARLLESGRLTKPHAEAPFRELTRKCRIYGRGCIKRGKKEEGEDYLDLPGKIKRQIFAGCRADTDERAC